MFYRFVSTGNVSTRICDLQIFDCTILMIYDNNDERFIVNNLFFNLWHLSQILPRDLFIWINLNIFAWITVALISYLMATRRNAMNIIARPVAFHVFGVWFYRTYETFYKRNFFIESWNPVKLGALTDTVCEHSQTLLSTLCSNKVYNFSNKLEPRNVTSLICLSTKRCHPVGCALRTASISDVRAAALLKSRGLGIFHVHEVTNSGLTTEVKGRAEGNRRIRREEGEGRTSRQNHEPEKRNVWW